MRGLSSIFIRLAVVVSQKCEVAQNSEKIGTYSSSRSSKVIELGANRKRICDFQTVCHSNLGHLAPFLKYRELLAKNAYFSYPSVIRRLRSLGSLWNFAVKLTVRNGTVVISERCMIL